MPFYFWEGQITKLQDFEFTEATDLVASFWLRNYKITWLRADRCLFISGEGQITELHITSLQRPLIGSQLKIEITRLWVDRCLFNSGEGQITELQDYEFTETTDLGASSILQNYEITSWQMPFYIFSLQNVTWKRKTWIWFLFPMAEKQKPQNWQFIKCLKNNRWWWHTY